LGAVINNNVDWTSTVTGRAAWHSIAGWFTARAVVAFSRRPFQFQPLHAGITEVTDTPGRLDRRRPASNTHRSGMVGKLEYNYMDFGTKAVSFAPGTSPTSISRSPVKFRRQLQIQRPLVNALRLNVIGKPSSRA